MSLLERIQGDVKDAMRERDTGRATSLRMLVAALQGEAKSKLRDLSEGEEIAVLSRERKKCTEAAEAFEGGGASDRAAAERVQIEMIESYLPEQMSDGEVEQLVRDAIAATGADSPKQMGLVMKELMPKTQGRVDGKVLSGIVQKLLSGAGASA